MDEILRVESGPVNRPAPVGGEGDFTVIKFFDADGNDGILRKSGFGDMTGGAKTVCDRVGAR